MMQSREAIEEYDTFNVGDKVRVLKKKGKFSKGTDLFSRGIYTIIEKSGLSFKLKNPKGVELDKRYKNWEIKKVEGQEATNTGDTSFTKIAKQNQFVRKQAKEQLDVAGEFTNTGRCWQKLQTKDLMCLYLQSRKRLLHLLRLRLLWLHL